MKKLFNASKFTLTLVAVGTLSSIAGCSSPGASSSVYTADEQMSARRLSYAKIVAVRPVYIQGKAGVGAAIAGSLIGAAAGSQFGGGNGQMIAGAVGAIAGAAAGKAAEEGFERKEALEITVVRDGGEQEVYVQPKDEQTFYPGQRVRLITSGNKTRVAI